MAHKQGRDDANLALAQRDAFVSICLLGQRPDGEPGAPEVKDARQVSAAADPAPPFCRPHIWLISLV